MVRRKSTGRPSRNGSGGNELGLGPGAHHYLDQYGHVQSVEQALAVRAVEERDLLSPEDVVLFLTAGTGYTWAATVLEWQV